VTEPTRHDAQDAALARDRADDERSDESRGISDVGLPHPGDDAGSEAHAADAEPDEAALDEVFPAEEA
jgi:hypothetical protein